MDNKKIQEERMKCYFIQATKEILKGEGLKCISVRNIAQRAGYSYATLYNYFKDVKDLIFLCIHDFQVECEEFVKQETASLPEGIETLKAISKSYMKYFIQYTGVYELLFIERINENKQITESVCTLLDKLCQNNWDYCVKEQLLSQEASEATKIQLRNAVSGLLLFYINRKYPNSYKDLTVLTEIQLNKILSF